MKQIVRKTRFIFTIILIIFTLVASNGINHYHQVSHAQPSKDCVINRSLCNQAFAPGLPAVNPHVKLSEKERFLAAIANHLPTIPQPGTYEHILLRTYGAAFVNSDSAVKLPAKVIFANEQETQAFQTTLTMEKVDNTRDCYLQKTAADALNKARSIENIPLKSGYGTGDCTRTFATNLRFWQKYANSTTLEKVKQGTETKILSVVAPPGTSQHLWGLAIDLRVSNQQQRQALNQNGWFQTVENDIPHWTYIGLNEYKLIQLGLKNKLVKGITYWSTPL